MTKKKKRRKKRVPNGHLTRLPNVYWHGRVNIGRSEDGPIYQTITRKSKEELEALILYQRLLYSRRKLTERSKMTLAEWATIWIDEIKYCLIGETTYASYKSVIDKHIIPFLCDKQLVSVRREDIERFIGSLQKKTKGKKPLQATSIRAAYMLVNQIMESAVGAKLILENPAINISLPHQKSKEKRVLSSEEVKQLFDTLEEHYPEWYDIYYLELMTGLRRGELFGLKWSDVNLTTGDTQIRRTVKYIYGDLDITNTKTNSGKRKIVLPESVRLLLSERKPSIDSDWIFPSLGDNKLPMNPKLVYEHIKKVLKKADLPYVQFHNLRHTFATQAISNGVEPLTLSNLMGHKIVTFTLDTYTHKTIEMEKRVAEFLEEYLEEIEGGEE